MKVVFLRSNPVNPDPRIEKEASSLLKGGHFISIVCWDRSGALPQKSFIDLDGGKVEVHRGGPKSSYGGGLRNLWKLVCFQIFLLGWLIRHQSQFDVIHAADFDTVLPAWIIKKFFRKKLVYDIFDYYIDAFSVPKKLRTFIETIDIRMINSADAVIIANEARGEQIKKSAPRRLVVLHNSPSEEVFKSACVLNERPRFVYVGVLVPGRLILELLELFAQRSDWDLHIAGFGPLEVDVARYAGDHSNIVFHGKVPYSEALSLSATADLLFATYDPAIPNHKYSSPNKLYEAMMLAKPIIVCNETGIDKIVVENRMGLSIAYDPNAFASAADELLNNRGDAVAMGRRGYALFESTYSWRVMETRLIQLYDVF